MLSSIGWEAIEIHKVPFGPVSWDEKHLGFYPVASNRIATQVG